MDSISLFKIKHKTDNDSIFLKLTRTLSQGLEKPSNRTALNKKNKYRIKTRLNKKPEKLQGYLPIRLISKAQANQ